MALTQKELQESLGGQIEAIQQSVPQPVQQESEVDVKEITKNVLDYERIDKQTSEAEREIFKKSIEIGLEKGITNVVDFVNWTPTGSMLGGEWLSKTSAEHEARAKELIRQRDSLYVQYKDDISIGTKIVAPVAEGLANIPDTIVSVGLATMTAGGSIVYQVAGEMAKDIGMTTYDTYKYYGRMPSGLELLGTAALSGVTSVGPIRTAGAIKKKFGGEVAEEVVKDVTENLTKNPIKKTTSEVLSESTEQAMDQSDMLVKNITENTERETVQINVSKEMKEVADLDLNEGATDRALQTSGIKTETDAYTIEGARQVEGNTILSREYRRWAEDKVISDTAAFEENILRIDREIEALKKPTPIEVVPEIVEKVKKKRGVKTEAEKLETELAVIEKELADLEKPKLTKKEIQVQKKEATKQAKIEAKETAVREADIQKLMIERGQKLRIKNSPKDFVQERVQAGDFVHRIAENSSETVKAYADAKFEGKGGVGFKQVEEAVKNENNRFQINSDFAENEMINELGQTPAQYIQEINPLEYDKTRDWVNGKASMTTDKGYTGEEIKFWSSRVDDADLINGMGGKLHTYDISDAQGFKNKYVKLYEGDTDDISIIRPNGDTNKEVVAHIGGDTPDTDKRIAGQMILGDDESNIRFNQLIDEATNTPAQFKTKYNVEPENFVKSGKELLTKYAPDEGAYLRLNQALNKQKFMVEFFPHYTKKFGEEIREGELANVIKEGHLPELMGKINPAFEKGHFGEAMKNATDEVKATKFFEFISAVADTRDATKYTGRNRSFNSLKEFMGDEATHIDDKGQALLNFFTDTQSQFLKNNSELVQDIFTGQSNNIARIVTYGSPSPHRVSNQYKFKIKDIMSEKLGEKVLDPETGKIKEIIKKTINENEDEGIQRVSEIVDNMFMNTQTGRKTTDKIGIAKASAFARATVGRGILNLTGVSELGISNYANVLSRAMHYNGATKGFKGSVLRPLKKLALNADASNAKYHIAQTVKNTDLSKHNILSREVGESEAGLLFRKASKKWDDISYSIQKYSDKQAKKFGEGFTVQTFDQMSDNYATLNPNLKAHFKNFGIVKENFTEFAKHTKNHIGENGSYVDIDSLMRRRGTNMSEFGNIDMDEALVQSYYGLSNNIGNPIANDILHHGFRSEFDEWAGMFRRYTRAMNADSASKILYYSDAKGVQRNRFMGARKQWTNDPKDLLSDTGTGLAVASVLAMGGAGYTLQKDLIYSNRKIDERLAIMQLRSEEIRDALSFDEASLEEVGELVGVISKYAAQGVNPFDLEQLKSESALIGIAGRLKKTYDTFTDEEKITYGTNVEEGFAEFAYLVSSSLISNAVSKNVKAFTNIKDPKRVYEFTKDQNIAFASIIRGTTDEEFHSITTKTRKEARATADYLEENHRSYNELPNSKKKHFEKVMDSMNVPTGDRKDMQTEYALNFTNVDKNDEPTLLREVYGLDFEEYAEYEKANPIVKTPFDKMSAKKKSYFNDIIEYKGITDPDEIEQLEEEFHGRFKTIKRSELSKQLKEGFGIDRTEFNNWYDDRN